MVEYSECNCFVSQAILTWFNFTKATTTFGAMGDSVFEVDIQLHYRLTVILIYL